MCFCDPDKDHLHLGLSVGGLVSLSKDILKKLTIRDIGCTVTLGVISRAVCSWSRGGGLTFL